MHDSAATRARSARAPAIRSLAPVLALLCVVGLILRIVAARGDLWLDEIWSFILVEQAKSFTDIVVALPYDNNHVLNSLWLKLVGAGASPLLARAPAMLFGVLSIPVAARLGARVSPVAAIATAAFIAIDFTFVQFGSEARGYAGLILGTLVALDALETRLRDDSDSSSLAALALAVAFGTFSHLTMIEASGALCVMAAVRLMLAEGPRGAWLVRLVPIVLAVAVGSSPALACLVISLMSGPLHIGIQTPFSMSTFADGLGQLVRATLGFWDMPLSQPVAAALLSFLGLGIVVTMPLLPAPRRVLPAVGLLGLPFLHVALHLPNQNYARFDLAVGICLALYASEAWARAWSARTPVRALALALAVAFVAGQALQLSRFFAEGRGAFSYATALMTQQRPTRLAVLPRSAGQETAAVMRWYAKRAGRTADVSLTPDASLCTTTADWLVSTHRPDGEADIDDASRLSTTPCADRFVPMWQFRAYGLSGTTWSILRHRPPA